MLNISVNCVLYYTWVIRGSECCVNKSFVLCDMQLMGEEPDLDPEISRSFFEGNVLNLDPSLLTENGIRFVQILHGLCD